MTRELRAFCPSQGFNPWTLQFCAFWAVDTMISDQMVIRCKGNMPLLHELAFRGYTWSEYEYVKVSGGEGTSLPQRSQEVDVNMSQVATTRMLSRCSYCPVLSTNVSGESSAHLTPFGKETRRRRWSRLPPWKLGSNITIHGSQGYYSGKSGSPPRTRRPRP